MGLADIRATRQRTVSEGLDTALASLGPVRDELTTSVLDEMASQGVAKSDTDVLHRAHLRYQGTDTTLSVTVTDAAEMTTAFETAHRKQFGFIFENREIIFEAYEVEAIGGGADSSEPEFVLDAAAPKSAESSKFFSGGAWREAPIYRRAEIAPGARANGPCLIVEPHQTIIVEDGWAFEITKLNHVVLKRIAELSRAQAVGTQADPVLLEVFNNLFMSIAEQMGVTLQNTASSVNIKERLDFSCAVFDENGALVANAPHMPVHLGSMDRSVESVIAQNQGKIRPGDVFALNAPYNGGTHLPDITVVTPVFDGAGQKILFYVASRGHHADVGGTAPGSMTPLATTVDEEGVLFDNVLLVDRGRFDEAGITSLLSDHPYPARNVAQNVADLRAQIAANEKGVHEMRKMIGQFGLDVVQAYMGHVQDNAEESVRRVLEKLNDAEFAYTTDQGSTIKVKITVDKTKREATVDFTGTSEQKKNNFNAPEPVTRAAVLYVFRVMVESSIPMNAGCLKPIRIIVPEGSMLKPQYPAAVVAGNVETSQHVTNALFGALGAIAASQGTMNNLTFGNATYQYYETLCSGSPAGRFNDGSGFAGTDAVHVHMTNSRLTDPEILETRYPVLLEDFHIRENSGGTGAFPAGDGTKRTIRFLETMDCAILSSHRTIKPHGLDGGGKGELGLTTVRRLNGSVEELAGCAQTLIEAGEAVTVVTPTAGGYGNVQ
jgi:5-oxoprolinase (ATP-hydrolysing)